MPPRAFFESLAHPVTDAVMVVHRADLVAVMVDGGAGRGRAEHGQSEDGGDQDFHKGLQKEISSERSNRVFNVVALLPCATPARLDHEI